MSPNGIFGENKNYQTFLRPETRNGNRKKTSKRSAKARHTRSVLKFYGINPEKPGADVEVKGRSDLLVEVGSRAVTPAEDAWLASMFLELIW